jgi:uncharacterized protein (TIGR00369 family)
VTELSSTSEYGVLGVRDVDFALERLPPSPDLAELVERHRVVSWAPPRGRWASVTLLPHPCVDLVLDRGSLAVAGVGRERFTYARVRVSDRYPASLGRMTNVQLDRERAYTWADPRGMAAGAGLDGLTLLRRVADGSLPAPPIAHTMGFDLESVENGRAVFVLTPAEYHYNPIGSVHGGVYATLLDSACGCAVHSTLPAGVRYTSLDLNVKFLGRMTTDTGLVRCEGWAGRSTVLARAELRNEAGKLLGEATSSCLLLR